MIHVLQLLENILLKFKENFLQKYFLLMKYILICYYLTIPKPHAILMKKIHCSMDVCIDPLHSSKILLPLTPPISDKYKFQKWEEIIGAEDGKSNLVTENAECLPQETNIFINASLTSKGCSGTKNIFSINGEWKNQNKLPTQNFNFKIRIDNENDNNAIAECKYENKNINQFDCSFDGEGDIQFKEKYFKSFITTYKIENSTVIHLDKCLKSAYLFLNLSLLSLLVLFLF